VPDISPISGAREIGRYFLIVSFVPSTIFVAYSILLVRSGAWSGHDVHLAAAIGSLGTHDLALFGVASLLLALAIHPLQTALIQAFEGYWGDSRPAQRLALANIMRHRRRAASLLRAALKEHDAARPTPTAKPYAHKSHAGNLEVQPLIRSTEARRLYNSYPHQFESIMPTRLGNVLRRYENLAGVHYGLDSIAVVPRILQVANDRDILYVHNQRMQMELALRTSALGLAASALTLAFMWRHGLWLLMALAPYAIAYAAYRGATVVAHEYGASLAVLIELNRFALYERLHSPLPSDLEEERENNRLLVNVLRLDNTGIKKRLAEARLDYVHPVVSDEKTSSANSSADQNGKPGL
jgi:hypothetical protein